MFSRNPSACPGASAGALSPEKGGALRTQSTLGRRFGVAAVLCGGLLGAPLLLLQHGQARAPRTVAAPMEGGVAGGALAVDSVALPSQLVRYEEGADPAAATPPSTTTTTVPPPVASTAVTTTPVTAARPPTTTTTAPPSVVVVAAGHSEQGQATWYAAAPPGRCASPTLPFGTVLTVVNNATGARTVCTVDDREQAGYPRVVDLSPSGFAQLASPSQGVVDVTISW